MNYSKTSMCYINLLPPRIKQMVYDFDGRYKTAKNQCIELIRQRGQTPIGIKGSDAFKHVWSKINDFKMKTFHRDFPEYYAELERRLAMYRSRMENGHIRGVTTHLKRLPKSYCFNDALGSYKLGMVFNTVIIDGISYKSSERIHSVGLETLAFKGVTTVVKCIDVLDPVFKKSIKGRQKVKVYRSLGVSENGIPASIFKKILANHFGFNDTWYKYRKCNPPASLALVTGMIEQSVEDKSVTTGVLYHNGKVCGYCPGQKNYTICTKTGTGILYDGKKPVGYITKSFELKVTAPVRVPAPVPDPVPVAAPVRVPVPALVAFVYNPDTDIEVDIDGRDYVVRNDLDIININTGYIVGTRVDDDEVEWLGDAR